MNRVDRQNEILLYWVIRLVVFVNDSLEVLYFIMNVPMPTISQLNSPYCDSLSRYFIFFGNVLFFTTIYNFLYNFEIIVLMVNNSLILLLLQSIGLNIGYLMLALCMILYCKSHMLTVVILHRCISSCRLQPAELFFIGR